MKIVVSEGYVYWGETPGLDSRTSTVWRVKTSGDAAEQLATIHNDYGSEITINVTSRFVAAATYNHADQLFLVSKADRSVTSIGGFLDLNSQFFGVDEANAYVGSGQVGSTQSLLAVPFDHSPPHTVATGLAESAYVAAVDARRAYASLGFHKDVSVDFSGNVAQLPTMGFPLTVDADALYAVNSGDRVVRVAFSDNTVTTLAATSSYASAIVVDDIHAYWVDGNGVFEVAKSGGMVRVISATGATGVAVDNACVYWLADGIWTAPK